MTNDHFELHLPVAGPVLALTVLAEQCTLSKQQLKLAMLKGAVWVSPGQANHKVSESDAREHSHNTKRLRRAKKMLKAGDRLHFYFDKTILDTEPTPSELIADFGEYSVWYKPCGVFSQGSKWSDHCTVSRWAEQNLKPERTAFVVHRLDRATSGLMLLAHSKRVAKAFSRLFEVREIDKRYQALVHGEMPSGTQTVDCPIDDKSARSHFVINQYCDNQKYSLLDIQIETGRKHQIRRHLAELGFPVVGDRLHGVENERLTGSDLQLCAYRLSFVCPLSNIERCIELPAEKFPWASL